MPRQLSDLEKQAFIQLLKNEKKYQSKVQKALADTLTTIRGEMSKIYSKYAKNGLLTRAEMTKYNKYQTMEKQILKVLEPAIAKNISDIKRLLPEQYNESFFHYAWAIDQAVGVNLNYGILNQNMINELFSITNPKNIELANALKNYGPNAKKYLRNALLQNLSIGKSYASMIKDIRTGLNKTYNEAIRLIRTEGQRALNKGQNDLYLKAKNAGVEGVDVWDATLDGRTRASHQRMDGVKRNEDGYFEPIHARYPLDENLPAEESINCRCRLRFEIEGYSPQLRRTREQGIIPYQTYDEWEKNYGRKHVSDKVPIKYTNINTRTDYNEYMRRNGFDTKIDKLYNDNKTKLEDVSSYSGNGYINLRNKMLGKDLDEVFIPGRYRDNIDEYMDVLDTKIKNIADYISENKIKEPIELWRGFSGNESDFAVGTEFTHKTFGSFSASKDLTDSATRTNIKFHLFANTGDELAPALRRLNDDGIMSMTTNSEELEFLMQKGLKFKVVKVEKLEAYTILDIILI